MSLAALIRSMADAGAPPEAIALAVEAIEARDNAERDRKARDAAKTRLYRERGGGKIPEPLRLQVYERDSYECVYCGSDSQLQCDHVVPVSKGGETTLENLATACRSCNVRKKDKDRKAFVRGLSKDKLGHSEDCPDKKAPKVSPQRDINQTPHPNPEKTLRSSPVFDEFWKTYPRREGANPKEPARRKFLTWVSAGVDAQAIIEGARLYAVSVAGKDARFVAQAVTWLNQRRWEDERPGAGPSSPDPNGPVFIDQDDRAWPRACDLYPQAKPMQTRKGRGYFFPPAIAAQALKSAQGAHT